MKIKIEAICYSSHGTADFVRQPQSSLIETPISFLIKFPWEDLRKVSVSFHVSKCGTLTLWGTTAGFKQAAGATEGSGPRDLSRIS